MKNKGWNDDGLMRFNDLVRAVIADRRENGVTFDKYVCDYYQRCKEQEAQELQANHDTSKVSVNKPIAMSFDFGSREELHEQEVPTTSMNGLIMA